jgi:hypothetical protein
MSPRGRRPRAAVSLAGKPRTHAGPRGALVVLLGQRGEGEDALRRLESHGGCSRRGAGMVGCMIYAEACSSGKDGRVWMRRWRADHDGRTRGSDVEKHAADDMRHHCSHQPTGSTFLSCSLITRPHALTETIPRSPACEAASHQRTLEYMHRLYALYFRSTRRGRGTSRSTRRARSRQPAGSGWAAVSTSGSDARRGLTMRDMMYSMVRLERGSSWCERKRC